MCVCARARVHVCMWYMIISEYLKDIKYTKNKIKVIYYTGLTKPIFDIYFQVFYILC